MIDYNLENHIEMAAKLNGEQRGKYYESAMNLVRNKISQLEIKTDSDISHLNYLLYILGYLGSKNQLLQIVTVSK
jgi:hypothetical protein